MCGTRFRFSGYLPECIWHGGFHAASNAETVSGSFPQTIPPVPEGQDDTAVDIQIDTTEDVQSLIKAIINANNNLTESNDRNDWEMMGTDLKELQELITTLEKMTDENDSNKADKQASEQNTNN